MTIHPSVRGARKPVRKPAILVTGTGGGVGQSILKALEGTGWYVGAADAEPLAVGLYAARKGFLIPYARDPRFVDDVLRICRHERMDIVFPGLDAELMPLAQRADVFRKAGVLPIVSSPKVIQVCDDKLATAQFLTRHGWPAPKTYWAAEVSRWNGHFPVVLKPKSGGCRSIGVYRAENPRALRELLCRVDPNNYVIQEEIVGEEYTCGSVTLNGRCLGVIVMKRELRAGDTYKAFVVRDALIERHVQRVAERLGPFGPCNFQLRVRDQVPYIFEINARCSGTTAARALAGFNEPVMTVNRVWFGRATTPRIRVIGVLRFWQEFVVDPAQVATLQKKRKIIQRRARPLKREDA